LTRLAVALIFLIHGLIVSAWISRIPAIQEALSLSASRLGLILMAPGLGSLVAMPLTGMAIDRFGSRPITLIATLNFCLSLALAGFAPTAWTLAAALVFCGGSAGAMDVAMNAQAVHVEERAGRPLMSSFHALFSVGGMAGAALGGLFASRGVTVRDHLAGAAVVLALLTLVVARWLARVPPHPHPHNGIAVNRAVLTLGAIGFCFFLVEGAMADWLGIYLRDSTGAGPGVAASGYAAFSAGMVIMRFLGDAMTARLGPVRALRTGALTGAAGIAFALLVGTAWAALAGSAVAGLGFAVVVPLVFSASGRIEGFPQGASVASVTTASYFGLLSGPALVGFLAGVMPLRAALGLLVALSLVGAGLGRAVGRTR
jgi:MFS family permease